jgi:hypothetical protein
MDSFSRVLPKLFRWLFTFLVVCTSVGAIAIAIAIAIDPKLPAGTKFGPKQVEILGAPGTLVLSPVGGDSNFTATALRNTIVLSVDKAGGLIQVLVHHGLPVALLDVLFIGAVFELLRRLFRNVGRGESFTRQTVQLVQIIGFSLLVFSIVSAVAENWFIDAVYGYVANHSVLTVEGKQLHLPANGRYGFPRGNGGSPVFLSGLLVLALSEVFRQGLALKSEHDLTV